MQLFVFAQPFRKPSKIEVNYSLPLHWSTYRKGRRRSKNTLLAMLKYVYLKKHRRRWWEISSVFEVLIFKRRRGYVYVKKEE